MGWQNFFMKGHYSGWYPGKYQFYTTFLKVQFLIQIAKKADVFSAKSPETLKFFGYNIQTERE